jgi:hypothetical protein
MYPLHSIEDTSNEIIFDDKEYGLVTGKIGLLIISMMI